MLTNIRTPEDFLMLTLGAKQDPKSPPLPPDFKGYNPTPERQEGNDMG